MRESDRRRGVRSRAWSVGVEPAFACGWWGGNATLARVFTALGVGSCGVLARLPIDPAPAEPATTAH